MGSRTKLKKNPSGVDLAIDIPFLVIVAALLVFGLLMLYSASWDVSWYEFKDVNSFFLRQLLWLGIGSVAAVFFYFSPQNWPKL
jgi:cell division protein FtsW (lipid II flippase)